MKKVSKIIIVICMLITITLLTMLFLNKKEEKVLENKDEKTNFISMMVEQEDGSYKENTDVNFVSEGYMFNQEKSGCENGGTLIWNSEKKKVEANLLTSDKCYAYFEKYDFTKSCLNGYEDNFGCYLVKNKDNTLIYHDGKCDYEGEENCDLEAGDNNYRYSGSSQEVNNYVCFGSSDESCPNDNLYRILGIFEGNVKIIKFDYANSSLLGENGSFQESSTNRYDWNNETSTNLWKESNLNLINLNQNFYSKFSNEWQRKMANKIYYVGGSLYKNFMEADAKTAFSYELGEKMLKVNTNECVDTVKGVHECTNEDITYNKFPIALMYVSDYYYAASSNYWNLMGYDRSDKHEDYRLAINNNWMYMGSYEWGLTRINISNANRVFLVTSGGFTDNYDLGINFKHYFSIRPVFYLKRNIKKLSGNGIKENPYYII